MGTVASILVRALLVWWVLDTMAETVSVDYRANRLRKHITYLRKWNERIGSAIIALENEHAELAL